MQKLLSHDNVPPDDFRYVVQSTGYTVRAKDFYNWIKNATEHLRNNQKPIPLDLAAQMEDQLCSVLPPGWCEYDDPGKPRPDTRMSWREVKDGMAVFAEWLKQGLPFVAQAEAERRARICSGCYLNVNVEGCGACHKAAAFLAISRKTEADNNLKACAVCKCLNRAAVHFELDILEVSDNSDRQAMYPDFCWKKKGGENYAETQAG